MWFTGLVTVYWVSCLFCSKCRVIVTLRALRLGKGPDFGFEIMYMYVKPRMEKHSHVRGGYLCVG